jgi:hypothetical protein
LSKEEICTKLGRAFRCNLYSISFHKGFSLQSLTQNIHLRLYLTAFENLSGVNNNFSRSRINKSTNNQIHFILAPMEGKIPSFLARIWNDSGNCIS